MLINNFSSHYTGQIATIAPMTPRKTAMRHRKSFHNESTKQVNSSTKFTANDDHFERDDKTSFVNCSVDTSSSYHHHSRALAHHSSSSFASPRASDELLAQIARQLAAEYSASTVSETNDFDATTVTLIGKIRYDQDDLQGRDEQDEVRAEENVPVNQRQVIHKRCDVKKTRSVRKGSPGRPLQYPLNLSLPPSNDTLDQYINGTYSYTNDVPSSSFTSTVNTEGHVTTVDTDVTSPLTIHSDFIDDQPINYHCQTDYNGVPLISSSNEIVSSDGQNYSTSTAVSLNTTGYLESSADDKFTRCNQILSKNTTSTNVSSSTESSIENSSSIDTTSPDTSSASSSVSSSQNASDGQFMKLLPTNETSDLNSHQYLYPRLRLKSKASSSSNSQSSRKRDRHLNKYLTNVRSINGVIEVEHCSHDSDSVNKSQHSDESYFNCTYFDCYDDDDDEEDEEPIESDDDENDEQVNEGINILNGQSIACSQTSGNDSLVMKKIHKKSKYRRSSCHCERAILDEQGNNDATNYMINSTDAYPYHTNSYLNDCIIKSSNDSGGNMSDKNKYRSQYNSTSNIFSTPVHRSSRQRAMDYRTYESLMALDSLINEARQAASYRSHSTLGQYSSQTRDTIDINDLLVYNVHHASTNVHQPLSPVSACTSPLPLSLSLCSPPPGLTYTTGSTSGVNQCFNAASASSDLTNSHHHHHHHHQRHYQPSSLSHLVNKRSTNNYLTKHKASYSHIHSDAITLVPVSSDPLNTVSTTSKILEGTSNNVHNHSRYTCNEVNVDDASTVASSIPTMYTGQGSSLQMIDVDVDCAATQCCPKTAISSIVSESPHNQDCISGHGVPSSSVDCDTLYTNGSTRATAISQQQQRQHRSLPASPSLEQSRRFISNLFASNSGASRRNDNCRSGGRSLLSSPRMLKKVIKQK